MFCCAVWSDPRARVGICGLSIASAAWILVEPYLISVCLSIVAGLGWVLLLSCLAIVLRALKAPNSRHGVFRYRFNSVKAAIINDTFPKVMQLAFPGVAYKLDKTDWYVTFENGSQIWFGGLDDKERAENDLQELQEELADKSMVTKGLSRQIEEKVARLQDDLDESVRKNTTLETKLAEAAAATNHQGSGSGSGSDSDSASTSAAAA